MSFKGSCACGAVGYEVARLASAITHCHCQTCRKTHAAAFNSAAGVEPSDFRWLRGEDLLSRFESSPGKVRYFCSQCGSHLVAKKEGRPLLVLRVATLDEDPQATPTEHIWTSHRQPWLAFEGLAEHEEWQPGRG
ncbi:GFA family protein [Chitinibacter sp. FCG-7]|uniref:GFA family protein n=1 Tax=Chitinibacter mangrovi TaxID=3153927 RepID=A0AAU7FC54_9NEIS